MSYSYVVGNKGYASDRIRPGGTPQFYSEAKAWKVANANAVGNPVTVHYDPANPKRAAIDLAFVSHTQLFFRILCVPALVVTIIVTVVRLKNG